MADLEKTIQIIFGGVDRVSSTIDAISARTGSLTAGLEGATDPLASLHDGLLKAEAAMTALALGGLAYAYTKSMQFQGAVIELEKVLGEGEIASLDRAREAAIALSETYGESAAEILASTADFKQAGFDIDGALRLTKDAMDLVIAGGVDAAEASGLLVAALKGFKAPATEAQRLVDILNEVSNRYATDVQQLAIGMASLSPIAKQMGFTMEETAGVLTPVIEVFRSGDEAAVALKTGLLKLVDDSAPVKAALASIGVSQTDANGALRSGKDILADVSKAFTGLEQNQKLFVTQQLVGINQAGRMVEVFDQLNRTTEVTEAALSSAGSAAAEVEKRLASAEVQVKVFRTSMENLATVVGDQFRDSATEAVKGGTLIAQALRTAVDGGSFEPVFDAFEAVFTRLGNYFRDVARVLPEALEQVDFTRFTQSVTGLAKEVEDLFGAFLGDADMTTPEGLARAIQRIVDAAGTLNQMVGGILDGWERWAGWLGTLVDKYGQMDAATARVTGTTLQLGKEINVLAGFVGSFTEVLDAFGMLINVITVKQLAGMATSIGAVRAAMSSWGASIGAITSTGGAAGLVGLAGAAGYAAGTIINEHVPAVGKAAQAVFEWIDGITDFTGKQAAAEAETAGFSRLIDSLANSAGRFTYDLGELREKLAALGHDVAALPDSAVIRLAAKADLISTQTAYQLIRTRIDSEKAPTVEIAADVKAAEAQLRAMGVMVDGLTGEQIVELKAIADRDGFTEVKKEIAAVEAKTANPAPYIVRTHDDGTIEIVRRQIDAIPGKKAVKVETELALKLKELDAKVFEAQLKSVDGLVKGYYDTIQAGIEWEAKLEIATVEANAKKIEAILSSVGETATAAGGVLESLFDNVADLRKVAGSTTIQAWVNEQIELQNGALEIQKEMSAAEIALMEARTKAYERGDAQIQIDGAGLQPHLESFMFEILSAIQIRANQEGANFLVGL